MAVLDKTIESGFSLTDAELHRIFQTLKTRMEQLTKDIHVSFGLKFSSGIEVSRSAVEEVLSEENGGDRAIKLLKISLTGKNNAIDIADITLQFSVDPANPISYKITSDNEKWVEDAKTDLDVRIKKVKKTAVNSLVDYSSGIVAGMPMPLYMVRILGGFLSHSLVPSDYVFAWGDGLEILGKKHTIMNTIFVVVILAFIVGVASGITANYISALLHIG